MSDGRFILGIDTSNYKTSLAVTCGDKKIIDSRRLLKVKEGERGLRQSEALFQHVNNLPEMFEELRDEFSHICGSAEGISAVAYSSKPRPVEGSYMPCFLAGKSQAVSIASVLSVPALEFSHQEGHIEAIRRYNGEGLGDKFIACHFSGGTCEVLEVKTRADGYDIEIIGGTKDISFGQVLDRTGVALGLSFPCGSELDKIALSAGSHTNILSPIAAVDGTINLSGFESQIQRILSDNRGDDFIREIFEKISDAILKMLIQTTAKSEHNDIIMSGGVSSSVFIRNRLREKLWDKGISVRFDENDLSSDNAVGIALLGSRCLWD